MAEYKIYNFKDPKTGQEEPQISSKEEFDTLKQKVKPDQIKNPRTGQQGDAETVVKEEDNTKQADAVNIAKEIGKVLRDALQEHGDELQGAFLKNLNTRGVTVKIVYKPDEQGQQTEDEFNFNWENGNISLEVGGQSIDLGQIQNRSGRSTIQKDLLKDKLLEFLKSHDTAATASPSDPGQVPDGQSLNEEDLWESEECQNAFCDAVEMYRKAKDKESIKALFRACRPYRKGNTIQEKLKGAVDWYNWFTENPPKNTKEQVFLEDDYDNSNLSILSGIRDSIEEAINGLRQIEGDYSMRTGRWISSLMDVSNSMTEFIEWMGRDEGDDLDEFMDLNDPVARGEKGARPVGQNISPEDKEKMKHFWDYREGDDKPVCEEDDFGPEIGDEVDYGEGHYKLYGYCGYEVVLQNVDDERDFKIVKPADIGIGGKKEQMQETEYIDPEQLPDDEPNQEEGI